MVDVIPVTISLREGASAETVIEAASAKGFVLGRRLEALGVLTGTAPAARIEDIRAISGVEALEAEKTVRIR